MAVRETRATKCLGYFGSWYRGWPEKFSNNMRLQIAVDLSTYGCLTDFGALAWLLDTLAHRFRHSPYHGGLGQNSQVVDFPG